MIVNIYTCHAGEKPVNRKKIVMIITMIMVMIYFVCVQFDVHILIRFWL